MKESMGYTVTLNIMIVFITIVVAFLCAALIYFKSNKVSNIITSSIEKYEGYSMSAINEISLNLNSIGYGSKAISCDATATDKGAHNNTCTLVSNTNGKGSNGYCVYLCFECQDGSSCNVNTAEYHYYKVRTNMMLTIPIIHEILDVPIFSNTNRLYNFKK